MNFLTASTLSLKKKTGGQANDTQQRKNICNPDRKVDITTLYLARSLGLSVSNIVTKFKFDESLSYTFPNHSTKGPQTIYPPDNEAAFPNLEQTYWTIISQYTSNTEPSMRTRHRAEKWCWIAARGLYDHCEETKSGASCPSGTPDTLCDEIWEYFAEACHRVHSLNPAHSKYSLDGKYPDSVCAPTEIGMQYYELSRIWSRTCDSMSTKLSQFANNSLATGWLQYRSTGPESNWNYKVPGTKYKFSCSSGFQLENGTNPHQLIYCLGSRLMGTSHLTTCIRKLDEY